MCTTDRRPHLKISRVFCLPKPYYSKQSTVRYYVPLILDWIECSSPSHPSSSGLLYRPFRPIYNQSYHLGGRGGPSSFIRSSTCRYGPGGIPRTKALENIYSCIWQRRLPTTYYLSLENTSSIINNLTFHNT